MRKEAISLCKPFRVSGKDPHPRWGKSQCVALLYFSYSRSVISVPCRCFIHLQIYKNFNLISSCTCYLEKWLFSQTPCCVMNQNQSVYRRSNKTEHKSSHAQSRVIAKGVSWQPRMQLLRMSLWFLNTSGNTLFPLRSFWDKLAGILRAF